MLRSLLTFSIALLLCTSVFATDGGVWLTHRTAAYTPSMGIDYTYNKPGNINIGSTIFTKMQVDSLDSLYTGGYSFGNQYTSRDSSTSDTTCLMQWDYIGTTAEISVYFTGTTADSVLFWVEQGGVYSKVLRDSGFTTYGLFRTDTLFSAGAVDVPTTSSHGGYERMFSDTFTITSPFARICAKNLATSDSNTIYVYLRRRLADGVLGGSTGRYSIPVAR